ncbi:hypothetical protein GW17_00060335 [Ensete ventricosum]|nr:hypothetical protein GW17_00060335 [Ensete ventricosum]
MVIPSVLAHGKSYKHDFAKKRDGRKLCTKSRFDRFFMHRLKNSKYWPFLTYKPKGRRTNMISQKNTMVINFA